VTGNLVLTAIAVAALDWRAALEHLAAIVTFLLGISLSVLVVRPLKAWSSWPLLPTIMGIEVILLVASSLALASHMAHGVEIFVILVSLALGLQNGAFRRVGGISVHTTDLDGDRKICFRNGPSSSKRSRSQNRPPLQDLDRLCPGRWNGSDDGPSF
jgi:uncharacterized membrane protein YoaK (UPF0700 family)